VEETEKKTKNSKKRPKNTMFENSDGVTPPLPTPMNAESAKLVIFWLNFTQY